MRVALAPETPLDVALDRGNDPSGREKGLVAAIRVNDQLRAAVTGIVATGDEAEVFEVVHDLRQGLTRKTGPARELARARSVLVEKAQHRVVRRTQPFDPAVPEPFKQARFECAEGVATWRSN